MDLLMIGSVNRYVKSMKLQSKWKMKKDTNDFSKCSLNELQRKNERFKKSYLDKKDDEGDKKTLQTIYNKIYAGAKLTPDEMKYLQVKNPDMYKKLKDLEQEKKQYERDLKACKTKEDVERLKFSKVASSLSAISAVKNDPNIPKSVKLAVTVQEQRRMDELGKIAAKFVKSGEYSKLPTQAEKAKAEKDIADAEKAEREEVISNDDKNTKYAEKSESEKLPENSAEKLESAETESKKSEETPATDKKEMTRVEAENTNEAKKVKRSKAKTAYIKSALNFPEEPSNVVLKG